MAGRLGEEISSTFQQALEQERDFMNIVYFMENCTAQNKNWTLFTSMVAIINTSDISAETSAFKFLEAGHTLMSADSIQAEVEKRLRAAKTQYDFLDFVKCVHASKINVLEPLHT